MMPNNDSLKLSPYLFISNLDDKTNIATNLATGEVVKLTKEETNMLMSSIPDPDGSFEKSGFLIKNDEIIRHRIIKRHRKACQFPSVFNLTLLPTLSCNFACRYCFEKGSPTNRMSDDISNRVLKLVEKQARYHLRTDLSWFGGEPLLEKDLIANIHPQIRSIVLSSGSEFTSSITTNGYLLDKETVILLRDLDIRFLQVTLDGNEEIHNKNRVTKNGKGTFNRVFENILVFLEIFSKGVITLRVNAEHETANSILNVLKLIPGEFRRRVSIHIHHIMDNDCPSSFSNEFSDLIKDIYRKSRRLGYDVAVDHYLDPGPAVYCYAERNTSVVIDPMGNIFRCAYTNFNEKERVGFLGKDGTIHPKGDFGAVWESLVSKEPPKCLECTYLPICGFGCPHLRSSGSKDTRCKNRFKFLPDTLNAISTYAVGVRL